jgi:hypothetical protein
MQPRRQPKRSISFILRIALRKSLVLADYQIERRCDWLTGNFNENSLWVGLNDLLLIVNWFAVRIEIGYSELSAY